MFDRRSFLKSSSLVALSPNVPAFLKQTLAETKAEHDEPILVVVELSGGNDGLNTVVPFGDDQYQKNRNKLRLPEKQLHKIADGIGLHPSMKPMAKLFEQKRLSIIQGVGYPNPNRSHDVSMSIWQTARLDKAEHRSFGWLGRAIDALPQPRQNAPAGMLIGRGDLPRALCSRKSVTTSMAALSDLMIEKPKRMKMMQQKQSNDLSKFVEQTETNAFATAELLSEISRRQKASKVRYPSTRLASHLQLISQLIQADLGTRVYYTVQPGYDTHQSQLQTHSALLATLSAAVQAFLNDLKANRLEDRVLVLCFSEFGRQVKENGSAGTDHGTSGPVFLAGSQVAGGLLGKQPDLTNLVDNAPAKHDLDFRQIYQTILAKWLKLKTDKSFEKSFKSLPLLG